MPTPTAGSAGRHHSQQASVATAPAQAMTRASLCWRALRHGLSGWFGCSTGASQNTGGMLAAVGSRRSTACRAGARALTSSERRICELASQGHSNAEIATLLHLALRTVETHLTSSFRKLGVQRRTQLARQLATRPPAEAGAGARGSAT